MDRSPLAVPAVHDPIRRLPYDVWISCIKLLIADSAAGPLHYLMVSGEWDQALFNSPSLWTRIIIENGEDEEARIQTFLHLSQDSLLDVFYRHPIPIDRLRVILETNTSRVRSIILNDTYGKGEPVVSGMTCSFPALRVFSGFSVPRNILVGCPNLAIIDSRINMEEHELLCSDIQEVIISGVRAKDIPIIAQKSEYRALLLDIDLPKMQTDNPLGIEDWINHLSYLSTHLCSSLQRLSITITPKLLSAFSVQVSLLHQLHTVNLEIFLESEERSVKAFSTEGLGHIRNLSLSFRYHDGSKNYSMALGRILEALTKDRALQNLEHLSLTSPTSRCSHSQLGSCVQSAVNARTISVDFPPFPPIDSLASSSASNSIPMNRLEHLSLGPPLILDWISAPNPIVIKWDSIRKPITLPTRRQFNFIVGKWMDADNMLGEMDLSLQEALLRHCHTITFRKWNDLCSISMLSMLTDVYLVDKKRQVTSSDFLDTLLQSPKLCPYLQTIRMFSYPYWELLYAFMRQRLVGNVSTIKKLMFPALPCTYLLSHTTRLLRGDPSMSTASDVDVIIFQRHSDPMV